MSVSLYVFEYSPPCEAVLKAAEYKGIEYRRVELLPVFHVFVTRSKLGHSSVPCATIDGEKVGGSSEVLRVLDRARPERPIFPRDAKLRAEVEEVERWGHDVFQNVARRLHWSHMVRSNAALNAWAQNASDPRLRRVMPLFGHVMAVAAKRRHSADDAVVRGDLHGLPDMLDKIDRLVERGLLGSSEPNAADFQVFSSLAMCAILHDVRPALEIRRSTQLALDMFPLYRQVIDRGGLENSGLLPSEWFRPLERAMPAPTGSA